MDMTRAGGSILNSKPQTNEEEDDTQAMDMTMAIGTIRTPQRRNTTTTPESSPFYNSPLRTTNASHSSPHNTDAEIIRSPLSTGITGTPKRTPSRGLLALDLLTGKPQTPTISRRKSDIVGGGGDLILGSPSASNRLKNRKSLGGIEEFNASAETRRVSIGRASWTSKEFGQVSKVEDLGIRNLIAQMTPKKSASSTTISRPLSPVKLETPRGRRGMSMADDLMLTPGMMKREFGSKVANLVKVWEDHTAPLDGDDDHNNGDDGVEEEDFEPITLAEFLGMTNISFLDGLGPTTRRRTFVPPEGLSSLQKAQFKDYAKAGAVSIPMLELYQFVLPLPHPYPTNVACVAESDLVELSECE
jgi:hypothetical protein